VTFFIISGHITTEEHRDLMIQAANDGHFFANHMTMDTPSIWFSRDEFKGKLKECQKVVDTYQLSNATQNLDDECGGLLRKRRGKRREDNINDMKKSTRKKEKDDPRCKFFRPPSAMQNFTMASVLKELKYVSGKIKVVMMIITYHPLKACVFVDGFVHDVVSMIYL